MEPDQAAAIAARNADQVERARKAAAPEGTLGDTIVQLDNLGTGLELAGRLGGLVLDGVRAAGHCVGAACDVLGAIGD
ncbi:hypothetical protein [Falsiroseomonas sp.]|uniref:hypothetical protein n=1 Tax=Falsiroseomonas sp. TaxID=2870721 RepID=UPI003F726C74